MTHHTAWLRAHVPLGLVLFAVLVGTAWADGTVTGHGRFEKIKGKPSMGYAELYETNLFLSPIVSPPTGPSRRLGAPPGVTPTYDGYYSITINPGTYSILINQPLYFVRPKVLSNIVINNNQTTTANLDLPIDYSTYFRTADQWTGPDSTWYQTFTATGTSVTGVVFVLAGTSATAADVTILENNGQANVANWRVIGTRRDHSIGSNTDNWVRWRSGEIPMTPGVQYAVKVTGVGGTFQPYKRDKDGSSYVGGRAYNSEGTAQNFDLNYVVFADNDGTRITMNKRTEGIGELRDGYYGGRWGQTFVAHGSALAGADVWAAGAPDWDLDFSWKVRQGGPTGTQIGFTKTTKAAYQAFGAGLHGVSFNPNEIPLVPGQTYFIEFNNSPGFNPYVMDNDSFDEGFAYQDNSARLTVDLCMTIIEYVEPPGSPTIALNAAAFTHDVLAGFSPSNDQFTVRNSGAGVLRYGITKNQTWLGVTPDEGTSTGEADTISIYYNTSQLGVGQHVATVTVTDTAATNNPQTITVTVNVLPNPPVIECTPTALTAKVIRGNSPAPGSFAVRNAGGGVMTYSAQADVNWLPLDPAVGSSSGENDTITVNYSTAALSTGVHTGTISVTADGAANSPQSVGVTLTVYPVGDFDMDGDMDLGDFGFFQICFNGPQRPVTIPGSCNAADFDHDGDCDLQDFSVFLSCFNGPSRPAPPGC